MSEEKKFSSQTEAHTYLRSLGLPERTIHPTAVIFPNVVIGERVHIEPYAVIGKQGFGFDPKSGFRNRWTHSGNVIIGNDVEIGAHSCIDGGTIGTTIIGNETKIDNLVHVGHNAKIGNNVLIVAGTVVGGSCEIGSNVYIGEGVRIRDHIRVGNNVVIGQGANIVKDVFSNRQVITKMERVESDILINHNLLPLGWRPDIR
jgi:UDP-3-O-[3-hydroxymyristoyl] glucosamine N-acyltransferase